MSCKFSRRSCLFQMLIEFRTQVLSSLVGAQDFDRVAVVLSRGPHLKCFVGLKGLILCAHQEGGHVPCRVIHEGYEVPSALSGGDGG